MNKKAPVLKKLNGFTLVEILIAGAIFAETAVVGAVTIANVTRTQGITVNDGLKQEALRSTLDRIDREVHITKHITVSENVIYSLQGDDTTYKIYKQADPADANRYEIVLEHISSTVAEADKIPLTAIGTTVTDFTVNGISSGEPTNPPYVYVTMTVNTYPQKPDSVPLSA
ncbi:hypothetical protein COT79_00590, partial [Candidatus Berkelbacteria bacterium CG10_big_fil_rev_8_21_14_0_10_43_14]